LKYRLLLERELLDRLIHASIETYGRLPTPRNAGQKKKPKPRDPSLTKVIYYRICRAANGRFALRVESIVSDPLVLILGVH